MISDILEHTIKLLLSFAYAFSLSIIMFLVYLSGPFFLAHSNTNINSLWFHLCK